MSYRATEMSLITPAFQPGFGGQLLQIEDDKTEINDETLYKTNAME